ncbi:hypothetical protein [Clostridium botulinum]|uniref:hypothetical protein n=1 Tax=Clostridium botulinum TaxID=1491 RepID=UPI00174D74F2|nr:hypothetical protein [Clostridium botulinum]MBD5589142.1 hypothetical protein [Clostridium botulinum]
MNKKRYTTVHTYNIYCGNIPINSEYKWVIFDRLESKIIKYFKTKKEADTERKEKYYI